MKQVQQPMKTIKTGKRFELYHQETDKIVSGLVEKNVGDGYSLMYERPKADMATESKYANILLTVEDKLDREDLDNINEILDLEGFSFVKFESEAIQWKNLF